MNKSLLAALAAAVLAAPAAASLRTVAVTGTGSVQVVPNVATVSIKIENAGAVGVAPLELQKENAARVAESLPVIKELVGKAGTVQVVPSINKVMEYNRQSGEQEFKGYKALTSIQVTLRGEAAVETKLGALFDTAKIKADDVNLVGVGLSDRREAAAKRVALGKAMDDAQNQARAQLEKGEKLGAALARGQAAQVQSPRGGQRAMMAAASVESVSDSSGGVTAELGKVSVSARSSVTYAVKGKAKRLKKGKK